jgi:hypothetical protein
MTFTKISMGHCPVGVVVLLGTALGNTQPFVSCLAAGVTEASAEKTRWSVQRSFPPLLEPLSFCCVSGAIIGPERLTEIPLLRNVCNWDSARKFFVFFYQGWSPLSCIAATGCVCLLKFKHIKMK